MDPNAGMHPSVGESQPYRDSGKEISKVNAPIVSIAPASADSADGGAQHDDWTEAPKQQMFKNIIVDGAADTFYKSAYKDTGYPFEDMEYGQGMFIATKPGKTTDALLARLNKQIYHLRQKYSEQDTDQNGDTILDQVAVEIKKRNEDGTIQLVNGEVNKGANFTHLERRTYWRNYVVKPVVKDQEIGNDTKAPHDGVLIIRVQ